MILHLLTDRKRLSPGADEAVATAALLEQAGYAVAAGIDVIQVRERDLEGRRLAQLTACLVALTRGSRTRVVVNDRLDIALAAGADGVHLRGDSLDAARLRPWVPAGFLVGRSVHSPADARAAGPVDYLIAGTVWTTSSKPDGHPLLGPEGLAEVVAASEAPVLAIGGVHPDLAGSVATAGAAGVAAIGIWIGGASGCRAVALHDSARAFRKAFETATIGGHSCPV